MKIKETKDIISKITLFDDKILNWLKQPIEVWSLYYDDRWDYIYIISIQIYIYKNKWYWTYLLNQLKEKRKTIKWEMLKWSEYFWKKHWKIEWNYFTIN